MDNYPVFYPDIEDFNHVECKYSDANVFSLYRSFLNVLLFNVRSIRKNFSQFLACFSSMFINFSFILLTETWLDPEFSDSFNLPGFYKLDLCRNNYGGGLRIFIKQGIEASIISDFTLRNDFVEVLTIECIRNGAKYIIMLVYHSPTASHVINNQFIDYLLSSLSQLKSKNLPLILAGDINLNLLNPYNFRYINNFIHGMFELGFVPAINIPTKVNKENNVTKYSIIDQFWVNSILNIKNACVIPVDLTDHFPVGLSIDLHSSGQQSVAQSNSRPLTNRGRVLFRVLLSNMSIDNVFGNHNTFMGNYLEALMKLYDTAFPLKQCQGKPHNYAPWMSWKLKLCIRKKSKLYKSYISGRITKAAYTLFKNKVTSVIRRAKRLYYLKLFHQAGCASKQVWAIIDNVIMRKRNNTLRYLKIDDTLLTGLPLVNHINHYFATAALNVTRGLRPPEFYPFLTPPVPNSCFLYPATTPEVIRIIMNLKNRGSKVHDIHPTVIKENKDIFADHLTFCYNTSLNEAIYPDLLKIGRITPGYKSGPEDQIDNYRPISALPSISKIYESLTLNRMMSFINAHSILASVQYGFRSGRSTTQAITKLLTYVTKAYHVRNYCVCFFLDLRKAFDTINHEILFKKLNHYGFRGTSLEYLKSYFTNRKQCVSLNNLRSGLENIKCGVPQGSILGPLCFNLYINDLSKAVSEDCVLFADDAAFIISSSNQIDLFQRIRKLFEDLSKYLEYNCLVANASKSKLMFFSSRVATELPDFNFSGGLIEWVSEFKYLGLILTNKLSYGRHIAKVTLNISRITGMVMSVRDFFPRSVLLKLYHALALPHVNLHIEIWGAAPAYQINSLAVKINNLLRLIFGIRRENGIPTIGAGEMYRTFGLLNVGSLFKFRLFKLLHSLLNGKHPDMFDDLLQPYIVQHNYATRRGLFRHPNVTCEIEKRFLSHQLIVLHEQLPERVSERPLSTSLSLVKQFLLNDQ